MTSSTKRLTVYIGRFSPVKLSLEDRLEHLRRFDTYERKTTPEREIEKEQLIQLIQNEHSSNFRP